MKPPNMTEPQWRLLQEINDGTTRTCSSTYKPMLALWYAKLIDRIEGEYSQDRVIITGAGKMLVQMYA